MSNDRCYIPPNHVFLIPVDVIIKCTVCKEDYCIRVERCDLEMAQRREQPLIQIFTYLNPEHVEMFISMICPCCWNRMFPPETVEPDPCSIHVDDITEEDLRSDMRGHGFSG